MAQVFQDKTPLTSLYYNLKKIVTHLIPANLVSGKRNKESNCINVSGVKKQKSKKMQIYHIMVISLGKGTKLEFNFFITLLTSIPNFLKMINASSISGG